MSALTGRSLDKVWSVVDDADRAHASRLPTSRLNALLAQIREGGHTIVDGPKRLRIHYATQTGSRPPAIVFFCNYPELVDDNFRRYLERRLRETFELTATPVRLRFRRKEQTSR